MRIAVVGASGEVGRMMVRIIEEENIDVDELKLFSSDNSVGKHGDFHGKSIFYEKTSFEALKKGYDFILSSTPSGVAQEFLPFAAQYTPYVIDNSSAFRQNDEIPLIIPEVNKEMLKGYHGIIANPNCAVIQMLIPLKILHLRFGLKKLIVSTYQSVSGAGHRGIESLLHERKGKNYVSVFPKPIDLNVIPQIGEMLNDNYCAEEEKIKLEAKKILALPTLEVNPFVVRVPVLYGHSENIYAEFSEAIDLEQATKALTACAGIEFYGADYLTPAEIGNSNLSHVGRLRIGAHPHSLLFWCVGHNLRLGAAYNAVNILKSLMR